MINEKILKSLTSRSGDPAYTIIITGFESGEDCNSEYLKIKLHQINKGINVVEQGLTPVEKDLIVKGALDIEDTEGLFVTKLVGTTNIKSSHQSLPTTESINSHYIEGIVTTLAEDIEIQFNRNYNSIPSINITMDNTVSRTLFKDYEFDFESHKTNNRYTGVTIHFNKLRKKAQYPEINILIIGDKIVNSGNN
jgi:hypothetical protein